MTFRFIAGKNASDEWKAEMEYINGIMQCEPTILGLEKAKVVKEKE